MRNPTFSIKTILREIAIFFVMIVLFVGGLFAVALIPRDSIRDGMTASAEYLNEERVFHEVIPGVESSKWDHYADAILLGIAWQYDRKEILPSVMRSSFYTVEYKNENENLRDAIKDNLPANQQYLRYWHGSILWVRPLLLLFSLKQIYIFHAVLLGTLLAILIFVLIRRRAYLFAAGLIAGLIATTVWFVPFTLEYFWNYLWMTVFSLLILHLWKKEKTDCIPAWFLVFGMVTVFFDFLTSETMTLTVPLLLLLYLEGRKGGEDTSLRTTVRCAARWLFGYAGAWCAKWLIACVVLRENVLPDVTEHVSERLGRAEDFSLPVYKVFLYSVRDNFARLFPFDFGVIGKIAGFVILMAYAYLLYVYRGKVRDKKRLLAYICIGLIPVLRFLVLRNHSFMHDFFTYRALIGTVLSLVLVSSEMNLALPVRKEASDG